MWNFNDYYDNAYYVIGKNPINNYCKWVENIGLTQMDNEKLKLETPTDCLAYAGAMPNSC